MIRTQQKLALFSLAALAALVLGSASAVQAQVTQTYTASFGPALTDLTNVPLALTKFDTSLGVLTGVHLSYSYAETQSGTVKNTATGAQNFSVTAETDYFLSDPSAVVLLSKNQLNNQGYTGLASGATANFGPFNPSDGNSVVLLPGDGAKFTEFEGLGNITLAADTASGTTITGGGGNIQTTVVTNTTVTASVFYTYSIPKTPEPGTIGLFASILMVGGGLGARRLLRKKS